MKISIITVCLNSEKTIEQTIQSVINQKCSDYEYIIIDGKSMDGTCEVIDKYKDYISIVVSEPDLGIYDAMNKGISLATGDIIGIINSDDWYEPGILSQIEKCFLDTDADVVYGKMNLIDENGTSKVLVPSDIEKIRYEMEIPHPTTFVKKSIYERYGVFQLEYKIASDYELMLRLYTKGVSFKYLEQTIANFRLGGTSVRQGEICAKETLAISLKYLPFAALSKREYFKSIIIHRQRVFVFEKILNDFPSILYDVLKAGLGVSHDDDIIIFGAGKWGIKVCLALAHTEIKIISFVDNDVKKWGQTEDGIEIMRPEILKDFQGTVLAVVEKYSAEISSQISKWNNPNLYCVYWEEISMKVLERDSDLLRIV